MLSDNMSYKKKRCLVIIWGSIFFNRFQKVFVQNISKTCLGCSGFVLRNMFRIFNLRNKSNKCTIEMRGEGSKIKEIKNRDCNITAYQLPIGIQSGLGSFKGAICHMAL